MKSRFLSTLGILITLCVTFQPTQAKLAAERWTRLTEEERHQLSRAERYVDQKAYKSALSEYELFLQLHNKSEVASYAQFMFAECTRQLGQVNTAINEFRNVIDYFPDSIDAAAAQYSIGVCQNQGGDAEQAAKAFEKVVEKWPKEDFGALARNELCSIYFRLGQLDKWTQHMQYLATGEYKEVQNLRITAQRRLVMHLIEEHKITEAYEIVNQSKKKDPLITFADWTADSIRPSNSPQAQNIQTLYGEKGKKTLPVIATETVAFIEKQPTADPAQKALVEQWCARIFANAGVSDKATERFAKLLNAQPENDILRFEYALHLRENRKFNEARLILHEMKDAYRADREIAETYFEEGNAKSCIEAYQAMLGKHAEKVGDIQWRLGEILQKSGKYQEAIAAYQQSQRDPQALFQVAECQGRLKQNDAAIQTLMGIVNFFKSAAPEAQYRIASQYAAKGDKEAAIRTLKTVCKVYLNTPWAGKAHQELSINYGVDVTLGGAAKKDDQ